MAAESNMTPNGVSEHEMESTQKSFKERLDEIPVYAMTLTQLGNIYLSLRERNETLKKAFDTGEYYVKTIAETAKPVVMAATSSALATAKPFIGEVKDPGEYAEYSRPMAMLCCCFPLFDWSFGYQAVFNLTCVLT